MAFNFLSSPMKILTSSLRASLHQTAIRILSHLLCKWPNCLKIEGQPTALRYFAVDGTAHESHGCSPHDRATSPVTTSRQAHEAYLQPQGSYLAGHGPWRCT